MKVGRISLGYPRSLGSLEDSEEEGSKQIGFWSFGEPWAQHVEEEHFAGGHLFCGSMFWTVSLKHELRMRSFVIESTVIDCA